MRSPSTMTIFDPARGLFIAGRTAAIGARPAFLLIANTLFGNHPATLVAAAYLIVAGINNSTSAEVHRFYYARFFGSALGPAANPFRRYVFALAIFCAVGTVVCAVYFLKVETSVMLTVVAVAFLLTEKMVDEGMRFLLFQNRHRRWGLLAIVRVGAQFLALVLLLVYLGFDPVSTYATGRSPALLAMAWPQAAAAILAAIVVGNAVIIPMIVPLAALRRLFRNKAMIGDGFGRGARQIVSNLKIWLLSLGLTVSLMLDRSIVMVADKSELAVFSLIVASLSIIPTGIDLFFLSFRRREILESRMNLPRLFASRPFWQVAVAGAVVGVGLAVVNIWLYDHGRAIPFEILALVVVMQICLAATAIAREVMLWNNLIDRSLRIEMIFVGGVGMLFAVMIPFNLDYRLFLAGAILALMLRLCAFTMLSGDRLTIRA